MLFMIYKQKKKRRVCGVTDRSSEFKSIKACTKTRNCSKVIFIPLSSSFTQLQQKFTSVFIIFLGSCLSKNCCSLFPTKLLTLIWFSLYFFVLPSTSFITSCMAFLFFEPIGRLKLLPNCTELDTFLWNVGISEIKKPFLFVLSKELGVSCANFLASMYVLI